MLKQFKYLVGFITVIALGTAYAGDEKYLIKMPGPKPALAKSFKDLGENKYEFSIDTSKTIKGGKKPTFEIVKKSLLKKKLITDVSGSLDKLVVTYEGDLDSFLKKISKTRIKDSGSDVNLAGESSVSDGGIRARTAAREPAVGEVKGTIVGKAGKNFRIMVQKKGQTGVPEDFPLMRPVLVAAGSYKGKPGQVVFFKPTSKKGSVWSGKDFTAK
ncbi:MAG: hypothetical protein R3B45_14325 [Bdellovibrionota bacterium]